MLGGHHHPKPMTMEPTEAQFNAWLEASKEKPNGPAIAGEIARLAYAAGADAELEACCERLDDYNSGMGQSLRAERRPKPPSLKNRALRVLDYSKQWGLLPSDEKLAVIREALESLPDD
jgi:hypothetical protein